MDINKKSRLQASRENKEQFVNDMAQMMVKLAENAGEWRKGWKGGAFVPFCAATGRPYSGNNSIKLMLYQMISGWDDSRWMTFSQLKAIREQLSDGENMHIKKGEKGVTLLRPEAVQFIKDEETGKIKFLKAEEAKSLAENNRKLRETGRENEIIEIGRFIVYRAFTVFNACQIEGFPPLENQEPLSEIQRNEFIEKFVADSGVVVRHKGEQPAYYPADNEIRLPVPGYFLDTGEYYMAKLHEFYHATGHEKRENRINTTKSARGYAFEEMRAEIFSVLAGAQLGLPFSEENSAAYIAHWNKSFSGGEADEVFRAASEASRVLGMMGEFQNGRKPSADWWPEIEQWPGLEKAQAARNIEDGAIFSNGEDMEDSEYAGPSQ